MPAVQGKQVLQLLNGMKDSGAITSVAEYNNKLQQLTEHLRGTDPSPIFNFFKAKAGDPISSDMFNAMVSAATFDLEAAFEEADNIASVLDLHKSLYKLTVLKSLEKAINELEKTITLYEFFNRDLNGFTQAQFNTFNSIDGGASKRSDIGTSSLFFDPRKSEKVRSTDDCQVDLLGEQLVLPAGSAEEIKIVNINLIDDADTTISTRDVQYVTTNIRNIIDQRKYTYWVYPILVNEQVSGGIKMKIQLDFGGVRQLNSLEIEPACPFPMILTDVSYISIDGQTRSISGIDETIEGDTSINIEGIETRFLTLTFKQESTEETAYHRNSTGDMWQRVWNDDSEQEGSDSNKTDRIAEYLRVQIPDDAIRNMLDIPENDNTEKVNAIQYTFGFDNIRIYLTNYRPRGIFVGKKFSPDGGVGLLGLRTKEDNPTIQIGGSSYPQFSFEYYVVKYNYGEGNSFINKEIIPIIPVEYGGSVEYERLFLVKTSLDSSVPDTAILRFTPNIDSGDPLVTENLIDELVIGTDYTVLVEGDDWSSGWKSTWANVKSRIDSLSAISIPTTVYIKFANPSIHAIYTASYQASTRNSASSDALPRKLSDLVTIQDNFILRCNIGQNPPVAHCNLYLIAIMRNNYIYQNSTPALLEYKLLTSNYDQSKFLG